jgi:phosphoribosylaminoimidazole carboxylase
VDCNALQKLEDSGVKVLPPPSTIAIIQDKFLQKEHLVAADVPTPPFRAVSSSADVKACAQEWGYPCMLKARKGAYDGRGNFAIREEGQIEEAWKVLGGADLYMERWCAFEKELAVMVARNEQGHLVAYPVVETVQENNICHRVLCPALVPDEVKQQAIEVAKKAIAALPGAGIFGVELFYVPGDSKNSVLLNEIAPRPHNSGHYTMEACGTCQFEMHLRSILGLPMKGNELQVACCLMQNVLGADTMEQTTSQMKRAMATAPVGLHWYNKTGEVKKRRKMGHWTLCASDLATLAHQLRDIWGPGEETAPLPKEQPLVGIIMGSDSDLPTMEPAAKMLERFQVPFELTIVSAHRTPERMFEYARSARERGLRVLIAGAGGAAHLPGMVAALTPLPVVGVPVKTSALSGVDSLHSIVQMPKGVPVATVAIGNSANAGLLAVRILGGGSSNSALLSELEKYAQEQKEEVLQKVEKLEASGYQDYIAKMSQKSTTVM